MGIEERRCCWVLPSPALSAMLTAHKPFLSAFAIRPENKLKREMVGDDSRMFLISYSYIYSVDKFIDCCHLLCAECKCQVQGIGF